LVAALAELADRCGEETEVKFELICPEPLPALDSQTATHLYRIAQEAVSNALRHARPQHIRIHLTHRAGRLVLQVSDDGVGIKQRSQASSGVGLKIMSHRAELIGGTLRIETGDAPGTVVSCSLVRESTPSHSPIL
jgi:signal transduction histidine kinase